MAPRPDPNALDLFDWQPPKVSVGYGEDVTGRGPLDQKIARLLSRALQELKDETGLSRNDVAVKMGEYLGRVVNKRMIDQWTSPGASNHRIRLDEFAAFVTVTGKMDLLGFLPGLFGFAVVSDEYREMIRLHEMREHQRRVETHRQQIDSEIAALEARVRGRR